MSDTSTDPRRLDWAISDSVIRLRRWGTNERYDLPETGGDCLIGSSSTCTIRLEDTRVSAQHALLSRDPQTERWSLLDLRSKNGVRVDGVHHYAAALEPCMEIDVGRIKLMAESARSIELRCFLSRILGWGAKCHETVDQALREIRRAQSRRVPFVLQGEGWLYPVAQDLHFFLHGADAPFVVCEPDRGELPPNVRTPQNIPSWREALMAANGGTLCIPNEHPPAPLGKFLEEVRERCAPAVQVIVCASPRQELWLTGAEPIVIPDLDSRTKAERQHIVVEYAADAAKALRAERKLSAEDREWVLANAPQPGTALSLAAISKATLRLTAFRAEGQDLRATAERLGMKLISLRRWFARRSPVPGLLPETASVIQSTPEADA